MGFRLVHLKDEDVISAAQVTPGFCDDLSTWRITISRDGRLRHDIELSTGDNMYRPELQRAVAQLRPADVEVLLAVADRIGFHGFREHYTHETMVVTDLPTWSISVRYGDRIKTVEAYGPADIASAENNRDMAGFVELWQRIHRHAPNPKTAKS